MCKPPTPDAMAAPDDVDVKETAPDAAEPDATTAEAANEETPPTCLERLKSFYLQNSFMVNVIIVICVARAHASLTTKTVLEMTSMVSRFSQVGFHQFES